jgi:hypothetical protein
MNRPFRKPHSPAPRPSRRGVFFGRKKGGKPQRIAKRLPPILSPRIWPLWLPGHFRRLPVDVQFSGPARICRVSFPVPRTAPRPVSEVGFPARPWPSRPFLPVPAPFPPARPVRGPPGPLPALSGPPAPRPVRGPPGPSPVPAFSPSVRRGEVPSSGVGKPSHQVWGSPSNRGGEVSEKA